MCGRFSLALEALELEADLGLETRDVDVRPRFNIAPTQPVLVVRASRGAPRLDTMRWGLIPHFADGAGGPPLINARAETLARRPAFRDAFARRRCLVLADGFYEWRVLSDGTKQPVRIQRRDGGLMPFAGVWERWVSPQGERIASCAIVTTSPNALLRPIHDRMPVVLARADWRAWVDPGSDGARLQALLRPSEGEELEAFPVSELVNSARNDDPRCAAPV